MVHVPHAVLNYSVLMQTRGVRVGFSDLYGKKNTVSRFTIFMRGNKTQFYFEPAEPIIQTSQKVKTEKTQKLV